MLVAARSSQDFACCSRATASAALEMRLRFRHFRLGRLQRDFPGDAMDFGLAPSFLGCFHRLHRFADAAPSVIELTEFRIGSRQAATRTASRVSPPLTEMRQFRRSALGLRPRLYRSTPTGNLGSSFRLPSRTGAFFVRQSDKFFGPRGCRGVISAESMGTHVEQSVHQRGGLADFARILERFARCL